MYPNEALFWEKLGDTFHNLGQYEQALYPFSRAIDLDPSNTGGKGFYFVCDNI